MRSRNLPVVVASIGLLLGGATFSFFWDADASDPMALHSLFSRSLVHPMRAHLPTVLLDRAADEKLRALAHDEKTLECQIDRVLLVEEDFPVLRGRNEKPWESLSENERSNLVQAWANFYGYFDQIGGTLDVNPATGEVKGQLKLREGFWPAWRDRRLVSGENIPQSVQRVLQSIAPAANGFKAKLQEQFRNPAGAKARIYTFSLHSLGDFIGELRVLGEWTPERDFADTFAIFLLYTKAGDLVAMHEAACVPK